MPVPVAVRICEAWPDIGDAGFERINKRTIRIDTGRLVVAGCTDYCRTPRASNSRQAHTGR